MAPMWLIIGLGNPGEEYADTYHNAGFHVVARLAERLGVRLRLHCGPALISGPAVVEGQKAVLAAPQTFMNNSGAALAPLFERFESGAPQLIVVYDDVALPLGKLRIRQKGSAGGHNGIKSIISALGSDEFLRVRIGIKPEHEIADVREFVLSPIAKRSKALLSQAEDAAADAVQTLIAGGVSKAMAEYNGIDLRGSVKDD